MLSDHMVAVTVAGCGKFGTKRIRSCASISDEIVDLRAEMDLDEERAAQAGQAMGRSRFPAPPTA